MGSTGLGGVSSIDQGKPIYFSKRQPMAGAGAMTRDAREPRADGASPSKIGGGLKDLGHPRRGSGPCFLRETGFLRGFEATSGWQSFLFGKRNQFLLG